LKIERLYCVSHNGSPRHAIASGPSTGAGQGEARLVEGDVFGQYELGATIPLDAAALLPPVRPSKIVAIGLNYRDHAAEMNKPLPPEPLMFMKPSTAVIGPGEAIRIPMWAGEIHHEAEMAVVIARRASQVAAGEAMSYVLGLACAGDITARELQRKDVQYTRAKSFDTFAPLGPCVALGLDPSSLGIEGLVNGQVRQSSSTRELIFPVPQLIEAISRVMTLLPGDVILTGTPSGVGPLQPGDTFTVRIEGVGELTNGVVQS
jgi:2-keto-4-pentenoate hydratase/2-oxohepta-3-ene-1,7-dioic acid hydratase in catechol pathway